MRVPAWRLALTGGAILILAAAGIGLASAAAPTSARADLPAGFASDAQPGAATEARVFEERLGGHGRWALRAGRHLVHAEVTLVGREDELVNIWLDHGTVASIGGGSLAVAEADGATRTMTVDDATIVYVGREDGGIADVTVGAEVFVQSRVTDGGVLAKRILVVPTDPAAD